MKTLLTSPILRSRAKSGKAKFWQLDLLLDGSGPSAGYYIQRTWWQEGSVKQTSTPERIFGKNQGRANATSDDLQAHKAFDRAVQDLRNKGFSEDGSADHIYIKPMLALKFKDYQGAVRFPVFVQPKLDGFRMLMDGENAWTRGGKDHVAECVQHLIWDTGDFIIDGELLLPGNKKLQITASAAKRYQRGVSDKLEYHVYDIVAPELPFSERTRILAKLYAKGAPPNVKLVPTLLVDSEQEVMTAHGVFKDYGYEGTMIRTPEGRYEAGYRSYGLLKLKDFLDSEFKVVDVEHGKGSFIDKAILVLEIYPGSLAKLGRDKGTFKAVPEGNDDYRRLLWKNHDRLRGTWWTIRYQTLSAEDKPIFPVAVAQRSKED